MQITGVATKTAMMTAMRDTVANGTIEILSASSQVLAIISLSATGGTISGSSSVTWTLALANGGTTTGLAAAGAGTTAASARIKTSGAVIQETMTVSLTGAGGDLQLVNTSISSGQTVTITAASFTFA